MRKIFTLAIGLLPFVFMTAAQRIVWTGNEPISWNTEVYAGTQFETPEGIFAGLSSGDTILASVAAAIDDPQYVLTYKAGDSWEWTDLASTFADSTMSYIVETEEIATYIAERGLIFRGQGYDLLSISIAVQDTTPVLPPDTTDTTDTTSTIIVLVPGDTVLLWENTEGVEMAWNEICEQDSTLGSQLAANDRFIISVAAKNPLTDWPKVILRDNASEEVTNSLLNDINTFPYDLVFTLTDEQAAALGNGFRISGDGVTLTAVMVYKYLEGDTIPDTIPVIPGEREEEILFEGNQVLSASGEDNLGIEASRFANMIVGDSITVDITDLTDSYCQLNIAANEPWTVIPGTEWNALSAAGHYAYVVDNESLVQAIQASGITIQGKNCTITRVTLSPYVEDTVPPVDPDAEIDYTGLYEYIVYQPESPVAISWDSEAWPGIKLDTRNLDETMFVGLQENDIIRVTIVEAEETAEFSMQYKAGDDWAWTDLKVNLATEGYMAYRVANDEMAMLIADRGLVIQGIRYKVSRVSVFSTNAPEGLDETNNAIREDNIRYNILGNPVDASYKGIVILNGKKYIQR